MNATDNGGESRSRIGCEFAILHSTAATQLLSLDWAIFTRTGTYFVHTECGVACRIKETGSKDEVYQVEGKGVWIPFFSFEGFAGRDTNFMLEEPCGIPTQFHPHRLLRSNASYYVPSYKLHSTMVRTRGIKLHVETLLSRDRLGFRDILLPVAGVSALWSRCGLAHSQLVACLQRCSRAQAEASMWVDVTSQMRAKAKHTR